MCWLWSEDDLLWFWGQRSKVKVRFRVWSMHCFRTITLLLLTCNHDTPQVYFLWPQMGPYRFWGQKVKAKLGKFEFVAVGVFVPRSGLVCSPRLKFSSDCTNHEHIYSGHKLAFDTCFRVFHAHLMLSTRI